MLKFVEEQNQLNGFLFMQQYLAQLIMCAGKLSCFSHVQLCETLWTIAHQAPLYKGFFRQEYRSGLPCPLSADLPNLAVEPKSLMPCTQSGRFFITSATWEAYNWLYPARHLSLSPQKYSSISGSVCLVFLICKIWGNSMYLIGMMWRLHELQEFGTAAGT